MHQAHNVLGKSVKQALPIVLVHLSYNAFEMPEVTLLKGKPPSGEHLILLSIL